MYERPVVSLYGQPVLGCHLCFLNGSIAGVDPVFMNRVGGGGC